jgi:hypothetical protein
MYGVLPAVCCCGGPGPPPPGDEYYVFEPCGYFDDYCCGPVSPCTGAPAQIVWCNWYAISQGLQPPFDPELCVLIKWNECCIYQLVGIIDDPCPDPPAAAQNIGSIFQQYIATEERPCCTPESINQDESGCLYDQMFDATYPWAPGPCDDLIAFEYDNYDQFGTVAGKEVKIKTATLAYCYETFGIPADGRCDDAEPIRHEQAVVSDHIQLHGLCIPVDSGLGNCENQRTEVFIDYLSCPECTPDRPCCGDPDPCEGLTGTAYDEYCPDPAKTYDIKTCYRVNDCLDDEFNQIWFEEDVLYIDFPWCHSGIDPDDPDVQDLLDAFYINPSTGVVRTQVIPFSAWQYLPTPPANIPAIELSVCDYRGIIYSGNANQIASGINSYIGDFATATSIAPWDIHFWFNRRQTCDQCDAFDPVIPPYSEGDELVVDRVESRSAGPRVYLVGRSKKKYVCASKNLQTAYNVACRACNGNCDVVTTSISAKGNAEEGFELDCLSPAEYSSGLRYSMRRIEQVQCLTDICVDVGGSLSVVSCEELTGGLNYPVADWNANCLNVLGPTNIKCRSYPHLYSVAPCDTSVPLPILCIPSSCDFCNSYQNQKVYCETDGSVIEIL